jgi:hypothetical protein
MTFQKPTCNKIKRNIPFLKLYPIPPGSLEGLQIFLYIWYTTFLLKVYIHEQLQRQKLFTKLQRQNYVNWDDLSGPTNWSHMYLLCLDHRRWWAWRVKSNDVHLGKPSKKQNQQDYAASQELDERSVSNPNICILLMENARN